MLAYHHAENVTEFVLHELCKASCFNMNKAAYFIDNPEFDCFKGIAGFDRNGPYHEDIDHWQTPEQFTQHMQACSFNKKVRGVLQQSPQRATSNYDGFIAELAQQLAMKQPACISWQLKHNNKGMLLFEHDMQDDTHEYIEDALHLLGFCPIF